MAKKRTLMSWSSGKDSAWTLHCLRQDPEIELLGLVTTINAEFERVAMHGVRLQLLQLQAAALGLPLMQIEIPYPCSNADYEHIMQSFINTIKQQGVTHMAFGDLYLEDIRAYRERQLNGSGIEPLFPLWGIPTRELGETMIHAGLQAVLTCVNPKQLADRFCGRHYDKQLLAELPATVDPCGENGEFHTFVYGGPMFQHALPIAVGEVVHRDGFTFADIIPVLNSPAN